MKIKLVPIFLLIFVLLAGCVKDNKLAISSSDIDKIKVKLIKKETIKEGNFYTIKLINGSNFVIKQNNLYVSFPIKINPNALKGNEYKVEAKENKLDIQPGEEMVLSVFMPFEGVDKTMLGIEKPSYQLVGYLEKIDENHHFGESGSLTNK